jgi:hypothetical protein
LKDPSKRTTDEVQDLILNSISKYISRRKANDLFFGRRSISKIYARKINFTAAGKLLQEQNPANN